MFLPTPRGQPARGQIQLVGDKLLKSFQERMLFLPSFWRPLPDSVAGPGAIPEKRRSSWREPGMCWAPYPADNTAITTNINIILTQDRQIKSDPKHEVVL
jgi:hypothetical protein